MTFLNILLDNDVLFFGLFGAVTCHIGFSFLNTYLNGEKTYADSSVQTDA